MSRFAGALLVATLGTGAGCAEASGTSETTSGDSDATDSGASAADESVGDGDGDATSDAGDGDGATGDGDGDGTSGDGDGSTGDGDGGTGDGDGDGTSGDGDGSTGDGDGSTGDGDGTSGDGSTGDGDGTSGDGDGCTWASASAFTPRWAFVHDEAGLDDVAGPLFVADDDTIYVAGRVNVAGLGGDAWVARLAPDGALMWAASPIGPPQTSLNDIAVDGTGRVVVVGNTLISDPSFGLTLQPFVAVLADGGAEIWSDATPTNPPNPFFDTAAVAVAPDDGVWVGGTSGSAESALRHYAGDGSIVTTLLGTGATPADMVFAPGGALYVAGTDGTDPALERRDAAGSVVWSVVGPGPGDADFDSGTAARLALDPGGAPVFAGLSDYIVGSPMNPTDSWTNLWVMWTDTGGVEVDRAEFDHSDFGQMALSVDADGRTAVAHRQQSGPPFVRTFDAAHALVVEESLSCPSEGMNLAAIGSDFVFAGSVPGAGGDTDAYVTRIGD